MPQTHQARRDRLRAQLVRRDVDAALITKLVNVTYLTGLSSSNAALLVGHHDAVLATDGRYAEAVGAVAPELELVVERDVAAALASRASRDGVRRLGFEAHELSVEQHAALTSAQPGIAWRALGGAVEELRTVKDEDELARLREACAISERALAGLVGSRVGGRTETALARDLENRMLADGADAPAFASIVASGPHSAIPHHRPTERVVAPGDLLKIDFGARCGGYHADMTRTFYLGSAGRPAPAQWQADVHALVLRAQQAGREAVAPGADVRDVDRAARCVIEAAGLAERFPHGLGHGLGLEIHEAPLISYTATGRLQSGTPVTVEPGVYLPGLGGVRIEDTLVVRDAGNAGPELLTPMTRELVVLG